MISKEVSKYLSIIGSKGGKKSKRTLSSETASKMVKLREARRAFKKYHANCFWSYDPNYKITYNDIDWVGQQLMKNGNTFLWELGNKICL